MIIRQKPKIEYKLQKLYERFLKAKDKTLPLHQKFLKDMNEAQMQSFMEYISFTYKYDLKDYEKIKKTTKNNKRKFIDLITNIIIEIKDNETWSIDQPKMIKGVQLGSMYQIQYRAYQHDPYPLVIFLSDYNQKFDNFYVINLHYIIPTFRQHLVEQLLKTNQLRLDRHQPPIITYDLIKKFITAPEIAFRQYKVEHIKLIEYIPFKKWNKYIKIDKRNVDFK